MVDASKAPWQAPWPGETVGVPQRISGWRVVAAVKLPALPGRAHRYIAVVEANPGPGYMMYSEVVWYPDRGYEGAGAVKILPYADVMFLFMEAVTAALNGPGFDAHR